MEFSKKIMLCLIGEQPIPILLPLKYLKPEVSVLLYSDLTKRTKERLAKAIKDMEVVELYIPNPYDIFEIQDKIKELIERRAWDPKDIIFNLTGGTKPMSFAGYWIAQENNISFIYLQTEGGKSLVYWYEFSDHKPQSPKTYLIPSVLTIDDYLIVHLGEFESSDPKDDFERAVFNCIKDEVDEIKSSVRHGGSLEIDLIFRIKNQVGIAEVKKGQRAMRREGIDQLNTAAEQRFLGTYTHKFLIIDREIPSNNRELAEAHRIKIIELKSFQKGSISEDDKNLLIKTIKSVLVR
ncbi:MAG: DUF1887 family CARF protein [Candidatus Altiarchaeota archaeon]